jgi:hypothetical protein
MGMVFNTPDTLDWVKFGHTQFTAAWPTFQGAPNTWAPIFVNLGAGGVPSFNVLRAAPLLLVHPTKNVRWTTWLGLIDAAAVSPVIGGHIANAIRNITHTFSGVEFHFVPHRAISATATDLPDQDPNVHPGTTYTKCITINTVTWDNLAP